jgi:NAD(P)-dependent dehydrogenase (short-subunit alcohol dehydrogenase family)
MNLAIITGGSKGLGSALVKHYRAQNWTVLELSRSGSGEQHLTVDLADVGAAMKQIEEKFSALAQKTWGNIAFINNAGLLSPVLPVHKLNDADIVNNIDVNVTGAIRLMAAFVRSFYAAKASKTVANISSGAAQKGYFGWSLYCTSKAGTENFIRTLAVEQAGATHPIACINIGPGVIDTGMQEEIRGVSKENFPDVANFIQYKESGQLRKPEAVARTVFRILGENPENGRRYNVADYD